MCGINLIIDKKKALSPEIIDKMAATNKHRGPDHSASIVLHAERSNILLASNQLKISDLTDRAAQPFLSADRKSALLFNGEIYNFYELKNKLIAKGESFSSHSDTEVLFHWLRHFGNAGIEELEGMFAFVFVDVQHNKVVLARDRFGIKPLYYHENGDYFIASSEINSILSTGLVPKKLNESQVQHYLQFKYVKSPSTMFDSVFVLEPGKILQLVNNDWTASNIVTEQDSIEARKTGLPEINTVESLITNSLLRQLNAQVPIGLLLSGGVDSTLLLALAQKEGFTIPTYSIVNSSSDAAFGTDDYKYSRLAAKTYQSEHHEIEINSSILDNFEEFIDQLDQPIGDSSQLMTSEICRKASPSSKVLISGAGADELFAGYNRHYAFYRYLSNQKLFAGLHPLVSPLIRYLPSGKAFGMQKNIRLLNKLAESLDQSPYQTYYNFLIFNDIENYKLDEKHEIKDWIAWALEHDLRNYLVDDVLALSDHASMNNSIELRVPYLDEKLMQYLNKFSAESRLKHGRKWILKRILCQHGGKKFANRSKEGFGLPLAGWLFEKRCEHLWEPLQSQNALIFNHLEKAKFDQLHEQQKRGSKDHSQLLWSILVLGHWLERNFS